MFLGYPEFGFNLNGLRTQNVSGQCRNVISLLCQFPLASSTELSLITGRAPSAYYPRLWELKERGFVDRICLGGFFQRSDRWWFTPYGASLLGLSTPLLWHEEWFRSRLLERLPVLESIYRAAASFQGLGQLRFFQWFHQVSWDAAVFYEQGWVAMFWSGVWQDERRLSNVFARIGVELEANSTPGIKAYPSRFCFVVPDFWQRELVFRVAKRHSLLHMVSVYCIADGSWAGAPLDSGSIDSRGWVAQFLGIRDMGNWTWEQRVKSSPFEQLGGPLMRRLFLSVAEWPGMPVSFGRAVLGEAKTSLRAYRFLGSLEEHGYLGRIVDGRSYRYLTNNKGRSLLNVWDRVTTGKLPANLKRAIEGVERVEWHKHERSLMDVMQVFIDLGRPVASGWRSWEHLGGGGGISPDGMVMLKDSPYGPGWHYVEYERSARGRFRVRKKLRGYGDWRRQDNWPVLVVCRNDRAERVFWEVGSQRPEGEIPMLTVTESRLAEARLKRADFRSQWLQYGEPALVG